MKKPEVDAAPTLIDEEGEGPSDAALDETVLRDATQARSDEGATVPQDAGPPRAGPLEGREIAGRYRLVERLGEGAHGEVWTADDLVLREPVALKWMRVATSSSIARVRREITTLRMLRIPGVVQLLDDGVEEGRPFLVMERVEGAPFPGRPASSDGPPSRRAWAELAGPTLSLLEVLARVHVAGVVHRDLKPDNILVSAEGRPTVLDFGVSLWQEPAGSLTGPGRIVGTPLYLAPEQIRDRPVDARSDLYAVGAMLYQALAGEAPHAHDEPDLSTLLQRRLLNPATPLRVLAPEVPAVVAGVIDRMLAPRPEDRFRSASEVLAALRGQPGVALEGGQRGPGTAVRALLGLPPDAQEDEIERLDPVDEAALRPLFAGPDRLFHLREDAARALWERTAGLPARVEAEVTLWIRLGLARWDGAQLVVDRDALGRLGSGALAAAPARGAPRELAGEPHLAELLQWLALGGHHLEIGQLARVVGQRVEAIEAACAALVSRGEARRVRRADGEHVVPRGQVDVRWTPARRLEAHRAIAAALRPGQEGRLFHLLAAEQAREAAAEAAAVALGRARSGDLAAATAALAEGLRAARHHQGALADGAEGQLLAAWVKVAFAEGTQHALDRVTYELSRAADRGPEIAALAALVRAGSAASGSGGARALALADGVGPFADPELERWRQRVRTRAAVAPSSPASLEDVLVEIDAWAGRSGEAQAALSRAEGRARLRYGQGRFDEVAALYAEAAALDPWLTGRIASTLSSASALLEAFRHQEAAERAEAARQLAARCRHPSWEGRAEYLLRAARYRMGEATAPDLELVELVQRLGAPSVEALACLNEAAVAFRAGRADVAAELAARAAAVRKRMEWPWGEMLARSLALACGARAREGEVQELAARAVTCPVPGVGLQALGLLGRAHPEARGGWAEAVGGLAEGIPRACWGLRMDVLSVEEALAGARGEGARGEAEAAG
ncbi:protein kinase domain-containing protein [Sorangium sp. So ce542]|uniref:serine/threonine-protein kinase n=1 Tax=Sorangium sp. So ce542 TaxID=3133316 RepID=UPI003F642BA5